MSKTVVSQSFPLSLIVKLTFPIYKIEQNRLVLVFSNIPSSSDPPEIYEVGKYRDNMETHGGLIEQLFS